MKKNDEFFWFFSEEVAVFSGRGRLREKSLVSKEEEETSFFLSRSPALSLFSLSYLSVVLISIDNTVFLLLPQAQIDLDRVTQRKIKRNGNAGADAADGDDDAASRSKAARAPGVCRYGTARRPPVTQPARRGRASWGRGRRRNERERYTKNQGTTPTINVSFFLPRPDPTSVFAPLRSSDRARLRGAETRG